MVTIAAVGNRRVISALVATVVPCENSDTSARSTVGRADPAHHASIGSWGVDGTLVTRIAEVSSSKMQTSVKVPPTSTATRYLDTYWSSLYEVTRAACALDDNVEGIVHAPTVRHERIF